MIEAFAAAEVRAAEEPLLACERGFTGGLMHRAATALALAVVREQRARAVRVQGSTVVALVGPGNNGGDALHALAILARRGVRAVAVLTSAAVHDDGLAALRAAGGRVLAVVPDAPGRQVWLGEALAEAFTADVVLDAVLGIGGRGGLRGTAAELVGLLAGLLTDLGDPGDSPRVLAVDVPSGIGVDDGTVAGPVLPAHRTVTFGCAKPGLVLPPAAAYAGAVEVVDLGLRPVLAQQRARPAARRLEAPDVAALWPVPGARAHKYTRGVVGVVAGSRAYPGAAVLGVAGALGAGCGMVRYQGPPEVAAAVLAAHPEVVVGSGRVQAWVLGPGVGEDDEQGAHVRAALAHATEARVPVVADAGALGLLPEHVGPLVVLTPHAGELARLLTARGARVERDDVEREPLRWALEAQRRTGATVLLKGAVTVVAGPGAARADGRREDVAPVVMSQADAPAWLATAGAGDVLAGVLGALLAGHADALAADPSRVVALAAAAAYVHGRAAHRANPGGPVSASAVAAAVPGVVAELLGPARSESPWS
ncbi:bifunctional ADP-dependent NAD(P)H-hydrate dehydratase/NAD(P)H-hydrate epimerase [Actinotalea subterranea]|uniref:bifunctional ADP-dependent NAD(P)H-hydrate dehydratase/NAD(P)H-hydrate epimerase n=1 Tax=Actinotalea subterranea TaxID=2607497 RepID=UPI0011EC32B8|nr:bifunctional ADP-dependent NAD(P)H-hydrate dehydratase/NAD(P)H-hydrate epimerase [Actinotalea subterranea]